MLRRIAKWLLIIYGGYLVLANLALVTKLVPSLINGAQNNVTLDYSLALTPFPVFAWTHDFKLISKDSAIEMELRADSAASWLSIPALFDMTVSLSGGWGSGVTMYIRSARSVNELCSKDGLDLPAIEGLAAPLGAWDEEKGPCLAQAETRMPQGPPVPLDELWRVKLDGVDAEDLRDVWLDDFRLRGSTHGEVSFELWPTNTIEVPRIELHVRTASIGRGRAPAPAIVGEGDVDLTITPASLAGDAVLPGLIAALSATVALDAQVERLGLLDRSLSGSGWVSFGESHGHLTVEARIHRGKIEPGTHAELRDASVVMRAFEHVIRGRGEAVVTVDDQRQVISTVKIPAADVAAKTDEKRILARSKRLRVDARADDPTLGQPLRDIDLHFKVEALEIPDLSLLDGYIPGEVGLDMESGSAELSAHLDVRRGRIVHGGQIEGTTSDVRAKYADLALGAKAQIHIPFTEGDLDVPRVVFDGARVVVSQGRVLDRESGEASDRGWKADVVFQRGMLLGEGPRKGESPYFETQIQGTFSSIRPFLAVYGADGRLPGFVRDYDPGQATGRALLKVSSQRMWMDEGALQAGGFTAEANMFITGKDTDGGVLLGLGPLKVGVEIENGESTVNLLGPSGEFETGTQKRRATHR